MNGHFLGVGELPVAADDVEDGEVGLAADREGAELVLQADRSGRVDEAMRTTSGRL